MDKTNNTTTIKIKNTTKLRLDQYVGRYKSQDELINILLNYFEDST